MYVSDDDLPLYRRAQEIAGGNLSAAIVSALRRYVDVEEGLQEGFDEIIVKVGPGSGRKVRFTGVLIAQWASSGSGREVLYHVYRSRTGKFVLHVLRGAEWTTVDAEGKPAGWRSWLGIGAYSWGSASAVSTLEVFDSLEALRDEIPPQLFEMVASSAKQPAIEDLDI